MLRVSKTPDESGNYNHSVRVTYRLGIIPFRVNTSAYTYFVGGASCPAGVARSQGFLLHSSQAPLLDSRSQCTIILEKWY